MCGIRRLSYVGAALALLAVAGCAGPDPVAFGPIDYGPGTGYGSYTATGRQAVWRGTATIPSTPPPPSYVIPSPQQPSPAAAQQVPSAGSVLPAPGFPVFEPGGVAGTVTSSNGNFATVSPTGGGAPGILIPNGNSTAMLSVPGSAPTIVSMGGGDAGFGVFGPGLAGGFGGHGRG